MSVMPCPLAAVALMPYRTTPPFTPYAKRHSLEKALLVVSRRVLVTTAVNSLSRSSKIARANTLFSETTAHNSSQQSEEIQDSSGHKTGGA